MLLSSLTGKWHVNLGKVIASGTRRLDALIAADQCVGGGCPSLVPGRLSAWGPTCPVPPLCQSA